MIRAGYRSPNAIFAMRGVKVLLPVVFVAMVFVSGVYRTNPIMFLLIAAIAGYLLPELWLGWRVRARQHRLRKGLPDALDLLVICVEAGLGLDQALLRVSQELHITHPELSDELQFVINQKSQDICDENIITPYRRKLSQRPSAPYIPSQDSRLIVIIISHNREVLLDRLRKTHSHGQSRWLRG